MPNQFNNIKIIGAGMPRTGTMSLKMALEKLGYNQCYHIIDLMQNLSQVDDWMRVSRGEEIDWDQLLDGYQAIVDVPGQRYYRELMQAYPDAKVILSTRDPAKWYQSVKRTIYQALSLTEVENHWWWLRYPLSPKRKNEVLLGGLVGKIMWDEYFEQKFEDEDFVLEVYQKHLESVKKLVPADQLLTFNVAEGWEPLCDFLGVPCPTDGAFPHANEGDHFQEFWQSTGVTVDTIAQQVRQRGMESPDKTALISGDVSLTWAELRDQSEKMAQLFKHLGLSTGDRVALYLPNCVEFVTSYLGIHLAGGVVITVNTALTEAEVGHILTDSQAMWVMTNTQLQAQVNQERHPELKEILLADGSPNESGSLASHLENLLPEPFKPTPLYAGDPAVLLYSSGTTGKPKGAVLSHGNLLTTSSKVAHALTLNEDERVLIFLPLFHSYALTTMLGPALQGGASIIMLPEFEANRLLQTVEQHQVTTFFAVPTIYTLLKDQARPEQLRSVRQYLSAGANLPLEIARQWQAKFDMPIHNGLGCTEGSCVSLNSIPLEKPGSVGSPLPGIDILVLDESNQPCPADELGEIAVRGPNVMLGYWNQQQEATRDGWFHTGDIGYFDEDGYLYVVDRHKDMVNVGGEKVYPNEVEQVLFCHPAVAEAAIYGIPHDVMGEEVRGSVVLKQGQSATQDDIIDFCREQLAHFKLPASLEFIDSLPKGRTGKVLRWVLRERFTQENDGATAPSSGIRQRLEQAKTDERSALMKQWIETEIRGIIGHEIGDQQSILEAGMDSLMSIQLTNRLSVGLGIQLPTTLAMEHTTASELTRHLTQLYNHHDHATATQSSPSVAFDIHDWFPQSAIQQMYFDWHEAAANKSFMNMNLVMHVSSEVNTENLEAALQLLLDRHPDLRLVYDRHNGAPMQKSLPHQAAFFVSTRVDCANWDEAKDQIAEAGRQTFDLRNDAMMRVYLFSRAADDHILLIVRHHIMNDRTTAGLLTQELFTLYHTIQSGESAPPVTAPSYFDFLQWHNSMLDSTEGEQMLDYWRQQLSGDPEPLRLPTDFPRHPKNRHYGAACKVEIDGDLTRDLQQLAQNEGVTLYTLMMTAYQVLLHCITGQRDILVDTSMINRTQTRFEKTIGQLSIIQTIRTQVDEKATFQALVKEVQTTMRDALKHQSYPSQLLIERLSLPQGHVHNRPGQVLFNLISANSQLSFDQLSQCGLSLHPTSVVPTGSPGTFHEINTQFMQKDGKLFGHINYETDLYQLSTVQTLMRSYETLLRQITIDHNQTVAALRDSL